MTLRKLTTPKPRKRSRQAGLSNPPPKVQRVERDELRRLKRREAQRRYQQSSRGRAAQRRYQHSAKGLMTQHRYRRSVKSLMCQIRYRHSSKGLARNWRFERTPARQRYKREWARRYRQTALCKEASSIGTTGVLMRYSASWPRQVVTIRPMPNILPNIIGCRIF